MRVLGIASSPRANGNSAALLDAALAGAQERGLQTDRMWLRKLDVSPCTACGGCRRGPICIVHDDMDGVYAALHHADVVVVATPIYFYNMSGWLKSTVDRLYGLIDADGHPRLAPGKRLYVITCQQELDAADGQSVVRTLERAFAWVGMGLAGSLVAVGVDAEDDHLAHPEYLAAARSLVAGLPQVPGSPQA
jgi:multimeric flavodoxin WrbA